MTSEVVTLRQKEWLARKDRIGAKMGELATFHRTTLREMLPDIRAIKDKKLWDLGGYESFEDFCKRALQATRQHIYKLLSEDADICNVLKINGSLSHCLTGVEEQPPDQPQQEPRQINDPAPSHEPPTKLKKIKPKPRPEPKEAEPLANIEPNTATKLLYATVCPECGQPIKSDL